MTRAEQYYAILMQKYLKICTIISLANRNVFRKLNTREMIMIICILLQLENADFVSHLKMPPCIFNSNRAFILSLNVVEVLYEPVVVNSR